MPHTAVGADPTNCLRVCVRSVIVLTLSQEWEGDAEYDYDDGLTADQRARLSLARSRPVYEEQEEVRLRVGDG